MERFPKMQNVYEYLVVAVDYFSRWIEAKPLTNPTEENVSKFFLDNILCLFGFPRAVITNHGVQFSSMFTLECQRLHIKHWKSSVAHPQGNGQVKAANKLILLALRKNLEGKSNKWVDELNSTIWSVRTSTRGHTRETTYTLVYGSEAIATVEVALPTARVSMYNEDFNRSKQNMDLDLLEKRRIASRLKFQSLKKNKKSSRQKSV